MTTACGLTCPCLSYPNPDPDPDPDPDPNPNPNPNLNLNPNQVPLPLVDQHTCCRTRPDGVAEVRLSSVAAPLTVALTLTL